MGDPYANIRVPPSVINFLGVVRTGGALMFDANSGECRTNLRDPDARAGNLFGWSIGLQGRWAVAGAPRAAAENRQTGTAYLFDIETGDLRRQFSSPEPAVGGSFSEAVAINDTTAFVGAQLDDSVQLDGGAVYRFVRVLDDSVRYYNASRTHLSLAKNSPASRPRPGTSFISRRMPSGSSKSTEK